MGERRAVDNSKLAIAAGSVLIWKFIIFYKFVVGLQLSALVPNPRDAAIASMQIFNDKRFGN